MELSTGERLMLMQLLPREGSFLTMKLARGLGEAIDFDEAERKRVNLQEVEVEDGGKQLTWDNDAEEIIEETDEEIAVIAVDRQVLLLEEFQHVVKRLQHRGAHAALHACGHPAVQARDHAAGERREHHVTEYH